ncbi:hypothetical protein Plhal703r1_c05g0030181 [Plasmopara halstedii]
MATSAGREGKSARSRKTACNTKNFSAMCRYARLAVDKRTENADDVMISVQHASFKTSGANLFLSLIIFGPSRLLIVIDVRALKPPQMQARLELSHGLNRESRNDNRNKTHRAARDRFQKISYGLKK